MKKYELLLILDKDVSDEKLDRALERVEKQITTTGGVITSVDKWGMKKFAYPINYKNEGYYVLYAFEADPSSIKPLENRMKVHEAYVRYMVTNVIENKKTEAAKTAKKPERRERAPRFNAEVEATPVVEAAPVVEEVAAVVETVEA